MQHNVVAAALANKLTRIAWSVLYYGCGRGPQRLMHPHEIVIEEMQGHRMRVVRDSGLPCNLRSSL